MNRRKNRRLWILIGIVGFLLYQQFWLQTTKTEVVSDKLPEAFDGFCIVQLSDLHGRQFGEQNAWLLRKVAALKPDLIAVTGDLLDEDCQLAQSISLLTGLNSIAPTLFVTGNHEWSLSDVHGALSAIEDAGIPVLQNESLTLERDGQTILVGGVDDPCGPRDMETPEEFGQSLRAEYGDTFFLLLAHRNETPEYWAETGADLVLAGHAHGGLIRLPGIGGLIRRGRSSCDSGLYRSGATRLYVSRGLGGQGLRLFNHPEISVIKLLKS